MAENNKHNSVCFCTGPTWRSWMAYSGLTHIPGHWQAGWLRCQLKQLVSVLLSSSRLAEASSQDGLSVQRWRAPTHKLLFMFLLLPDAIGQSTSQGHNQIRELKKQTPLLMGVVAESHCKGTWIPGWEGFMASFANYHTRSIQYKVNTEMWQFSN